MAKTVFMTKKVQFWEITFWFSALFLLLVLGRPVLGLEAQEQEIVTPQAVTPKAVTQEIVTPQTVTQEAVTPQTSASATMTLAQLEQMALANHPSLRAYEQKICALNGRWQQAGLGPNPEIAYSGEEMSSASPGGRQGIELSQEILGGSQLYHAQNVVAQQSETVRQELEMAKLRVLTDVRVAAYEYLAVQNKLLHLREIYRNDTQMAEKIEISFKNQNASRLDLVNSRILARKSEQQYLTVQNELKAAWGRLACLVGNPEMEPCLVNAKLDQISEQKTWEYYSRLLLESSPELARAQAQVAEARRKIDLENAKSSTNVTVSAGMAFNSEADVMEGNVGLSVPLRIRDRNQGSIAAARSEAIQAQRECERVALSVQHRLADVYARYANACKDLELYRDALIPEAKEALTLAQTAYENRETGMLELLSAQRTFRETNIEYYDALCQYWTSLTILEGKLLSGGLENSSF